MCGRYTLTIELELLEILFHATIPRLEYYPRYNVAPTQEVPVITFINNQRVVQIMKWGLIPHWSKDPSMGSKLFNARSETIYEKPSFRHSFQTKRCLVPADGFFEWKKEENRRIPMYITVPDHPIFTFAGIWDQWISPEHILVQSFSIITTEANAYIHPLHHRMPVILDEPEKQQLWLESNNFQELKDLMEPYPKEMTLYPVSNAVNAVKNDSPDCIKQKFTDDQLNIFGLLE